MIDEVQVLQHARATYGDHAEDWMEKPLTTLNGRSPREVLAEPNGADRVDSLLTQIDEGMFI
jgi:uncharacterized protein (DUF2384 family)